MGRIIYHTLEFTRNKDLGSDEPLLVFKAAKHAGRRLSVAPGPHEMTLGDWLDLEEWLDLYLPELSGEHAKRCLRLAGRIRRLIQGPPSRIVETQPERIPEPAAPAKKTTDKQLALF